MTISSANFWQTIVNYKSKTQFTILSNLFKFASILLSAHCLSFTNLFSKKLKTKKIKNSKKVKRIYVGVGFKITISLQTLTISSFDCYYKRAISLKIQFPICYQDKSGTFWVLNSLKLKNPVVWIFCIKHTPLFFFQLWSSFLSGKKSES